MYLPNGEHSEKTYQQRQTRDSSQVAAELEQLFVESRRVIELCINIASSLRMLALSLPVESRQEST